MGGNSSLIPSMVGNPNQRGYMGGKQSAVIKMAPKVRIDSYIPQSFVVNSHSRAYQERRDYSLHATALLKTLVRPIQELQPNLA